MFAIESHVTPGVVSRRTERRASVGTENRAPAAAVVEVSSSRPASWYRRVGILVSWHA